MCAALLIPRPASNSIAEAAERHESALKTIKLERDVVVNEVAKHNERIRKQWADDRNVLLSSFKERKVELKTVLQHHAESLKKAVGGVRAQLAAEQKASAQWKAAYDEVKSQLKTERKVAAMSKAQLEVEKLAVAYWKSAHDGVRVKLDAATTRTNQCHRTFCTTFRGHCKEWLSKAPTSFPRDFEAVVARSWQEASSFAMELVKDFKRHHRFTTSDFTFAMSQYGTLHMLQKIIMEARSKERHPVILRSFFAKADAHAQLVLKDAGGRMPSGAEMNSHINSLWKVCTAADPELKAAFDGLHSFQFVVTQAFQTEVIKRTQAALKASLMAPPPVPDAPLVRRLRSEIQDLQIKFKASPKSASRITVDDIAFDDGVVPMLPPPKAGAAAEKQFDGTWKDLHLCERCLEPFPSAKFLDVHRAHHCTVAAASKTIIVD